MSGGKTEGRPGCRETGHGAAGAVHLGLVGSSYLTTAGVSDASLNFYVSQFCERTGWLLGDTHSSVSTIKRFSSDSNVCECVRVMGGVAYISRERQMVSYFTCDFSIGLTFFKMNSF